MTRQRRVLVVGSSCEVLGRLLRRLTDQGNEVESAFDGHASLTLLDQWQPDLILLATPLKHLALPAFLAEQHRRGYTGAIFVVALGADDALEAVRVDGNRGVGWTDLTWDDLQPERPSPVAVMDAERVDGLLVVSAIHDVAHRRAVEQRQGESIELISHEIRNALTLISAYSELLQRHGASSSGAADVIVKQTRQLDRLVGELLGVTRRGVEQIMLQCDEVDLVTLAQACASQAQELSRSHTVRLHVPAEPVVGRWDAGRLQQVLQNLLTNAIKYSPDGGEILVRVEALDEEARVSVVDQGLGIAPEALPHVFERLFRSHEAGASDIPGVGLGLFIVRTLVEAHGGQIAVESEPGRGSTFALTLPYQIKAHRTVNGSANGHHNRAAERQMAAIQVRPGCRSTGRASAGRGPSPGCPARRRSARRPNRATDDVS